MSPLSNSVVRGAAWGLSVAMVWLALGLISSLGKLALDNTAGGTPLSAIGALLIAVVVGGLGGALFEGARSKVRRHPG